MGASADSRVPEIELHGAAGLQRMSARGHFVVPDPAVYRSTWRHVTVDGVRLGEWSTSPVAGALAGDPGAPAVVVLRVVAGRVQYSSGGDAVEARSGSMHLLSAAEGVRFSVPGPARLVRVIVPSGLLPAEIRHATAAAMGALAPTRITSGFSALVDQVLDPTVGGAASPAAGAVRPLVAAVIEDALPGGTEHDLRGRMLAHIERRIGEPALGPRSIASEFGMSLRWVHAVFNVEGCSLAKHIRRRRLDLVAEQLRESHRFPRIAALAERHGFANREQLTRAFKARYGVTIAEYTVLAGEGRAPSPDRDEQMRTA